MHSGADVEAFQAALNRDIGGDVSNLQPSDSSAGCHVASQFIIFAVILVLVFSLFLLSSS
ncbi:Transcription initiation factor TFIID subunit 4b [Populus alba x Populus x berolinensis]|nr:Transcription initiation factor TFIID subunit 4b [Populus alba x Populus x berolinensis]